MKVFLLFLLLVTSSVAQDAIEAAQPARQVRLELLVVRLPEQRAITLQADLRDPKRAKRGQQALLDLIEKNQAELVDWPLVRTLGSNRAVSENISEIRYPIEFAQPRVIENPVSPDAVITLRPQAPELSEIKTEAAKTTTSTGFPALVAGLPTTFETRNAGVTLEVEPIISDDGKTVTMQLAPQHVAFKGFHRTIVEASGQYRVSVDQPQFQTQKVSTNIVTKSGEPCLLSFKKLVDPKGIVEIFMLTATVETIAAGDAPSSTTDKPAAPDEGGKTPSERK
jgi:hypothetical protein